MDRLDGCGFSKPDARPPTSRPGWSGGVIFRVDFIAMRSNINADGNPRAPRM